MIIEQPFAMAETVDCINYLKWLIANKLAYHFDDEPKSIIWSIDLESEEIAILQRNHDALWEICDPWKLLTDNPDLHEQYIEGD